MTQFNTIIKLDSDVIDYLEKRNKNTITLIIKISGGGCCPTFESADIELKTPEHLHNYYHIEQDDLHFYIMKTAKISAPVLRFALEKSFLSKTIVPLGLSLKKHD